ncbi:MAG: hypothetical protein K9G46_04880 [Flavobacteriales bacterium]|nr:hypothetical protein [Flavobacteriales bacterium]
MKVEVIDVLPLVAVPSASGIAICGNLIFAIGDDSPFLHQLDRKLKPISNWPLFTSEQMETGRIPKSEKPDLEAMELVNGEELVIFGSGSKSPERDVFIRVKVNEPPRTETYYISEFYSHLKELPVMEGSELNIEAAAFHNGKMLLFNRRSPVLFEFNYEGFIKHLIQNGPIPPVNAYKIQLPCIDGVDSGFSGATVSMQTGRLIVTASVEDTSNAYDDGRVLGSFVGWVPLDEYERSENYEFVRLQNENHVFKVESVALEHENSDTELIVLMTTDNDGGISQLIRARLNW